MHEKGEVEIEDCKVIIDHCSWIYVAEFVWFELKENVSYHISINVLFVRI